MNRCKGFTLLELLIVVSIIGVMLALAFPSFESLISRMRAKAAQQQVLSAIRLARVEAIKQGIPVVLCATSNNQQCGDDWASGQLLLAGKTVLKTFPALSKAMLTWVGFPVGNQLVFDDRHYVNGTFTFCSDDKTQGWKIILSQTGRARVETYECL